MNSAATATPRILIVDDDAGQRSLLDTFLHGQGFDTLPVSSGDEALKVLRDQTFNMIDRKSTRLNSSHRL